jgi:cysteine synthase A
MATSNTAAPTDRVRLSTTEVIGGTPLIRVNRAVPGIGGVILLKCEQFNPLSSVKDRIGLAMIEDAEARGLIQPDTHLVEPTSGNTGIALAFVAAARGYKLTLTMPESMSVERRALLRALGASLILTPAHKGMRGAIERAQHLVTTLPRAWMPMQFDNPANPAVHERTTGPEIWSDSGGRIDAIVAGVGTGGTITGVTRFIRRHNPAFKAIAVEPAESPVLSGGRPSPHKIQGIGPGFVPKNLDTSVIDEVIQVGHEEAYAWALRLAKEEGILGGISSGANLAAAAKIAARPEYRDRRIVTIVCSTGERYLSSEMFAGLTG